MQKWEYLFVVGDISGREWRPRVINGKVIEDWKKGPIVILNELCHILLSPHKTRK